MTDRLDELVGAVLASSRYRHLDAGFVAGVGGRELANRPGFDEAVKATKRRLHQATGAYWRKRPRYDRWLAELETAADAGDPAALRAAAGGVMRWHASTAERLPILADFYAAAFAGLGEIGAVLDLGCGLNPLAAPWMGLSPGARYHACDVDAAMMEFVGAWLGLAGLAGTATTCDLLAGAPPRRADVALLLKLVPSLEAHDPAAPTRLLAGVDAPAAVVTYPTGSLSRVRSTSFALNFRLIEEAAEHGWSVREHRFASEVVFVLTR